MAIRNSERCISLAEHLAFRPEQEAHQVPKKARYRLSGAELRMSRRPTKITALAEASRQPNIQTSQKTGISRESIEPTFPTREPEPGLRLRFDEIEKQGTDVVEPSFAPAQRAGHNPSTFLECAVHMETKPHGSMGDESRQVLLTQRRRPVSPSVLNINPRSTKNPTAAASHIENGHRQDMAMPIPLLEKRQNPVLVSDLRLKARPDNVPVTTLELSQEFQPVKPQVLPRPGRAEKLQNPVLISELRLNPRPSGQPALFRSQRVVSDAAPVSAADMAPKRPNNRIFAANLTLNPRPSQYSVKATSTGAWVSSSEASDEHVEGAAVLVPSPSTAPSASTVESPAPTSPESIGSLPLQALQAVPALTSTLQGIAFHPAGFFSSSDLASSSASIHSISSNQSDLLDLNIPPTATASTIDMVPPQKWSRSNNASYAKAASAKENTFAKATASKAASNKAALTKPTSAMVPPFSVKTNNTVIPATKGPSTSVSVTEKAVSSAQGNPIEAASADPEMTIAASSAAAPTSNDGAVVPVTDKSDVAAQGPSRAVMKVSLCSDLKTEYRS